MKTVYSGRFMSIDSGMLELLKSWRQTTQFSGDNDWVFASPVKLGRLPVSYPWVWKVFQRAGTQAGIGKLGTRSLDTAIVHGWTRSELRLQWRLRQPALEWPTLIGPAMSGRSASCPGSFSSQSGLRDRHKSSECCRVAPAKSGRISALLEPVNWICPGLDNPGIRPKVRG